MSPTFPNGVYELFDFMTQLEGLNNEVNLARQYITSLIREGWDIQRKIDTINLLPKTKTRSGQLRGFAQRKQMIDDLYIQHYEKMMSTSQEITALMHTFYSPHHAVITSTNDSSI